MQNTFLLRHLRRLTKQDWRELRKFVRSPFFNQREDVIRLFDYLDGALSGQKVAALQQEIVWKQVFPGQAFDEKTLHYTSSFLLKTIRQYLTLSEALEDEMQQQLYLCRALRKRGLDEAFEKEMTAAEALQQKQNLRNTRYHYDRYLLEQERAALTM